MNMPFAKVDVEKRIVSGFATLNNLDKQKDIVLTEASVQAFKSFRGNIRELHEKIAAGRLLSFGVEQYYDTVANKVYDGIFVRAYISKGAPNTWEKVLDGTLTGFSIGGEIIDSENTIDEEGNVIRVIKKYELAELSLVDNPANPLANVVSIEKAHGFFDDIANTIEEKELNDMTSKVTKSDEVAETVEVVEEVAVEEAVVEEAAPVVEEVAEVVEEVEAPKAEQADETLSESVENVDSISEAGSVDVLDAIKGMNALIEETNTKTAEAFGLIVEQLQSMRTGIQANTDELVSVKSTVAEFDKRVESVEADTAVRKSGDLGEVAQEREVTQKSTWGGVFLSAANLTK